MKHPIPACISILVLCALALTAFASPAEPASAADAVFAVLETSPALRSSPEETTLSLEDAQSILDALAPYPVAGLDAFAAATDALFDDSGTVYKYEWTQDLLEVPLGSFYGWGVLDKHRFDALMVSLGQLDQCVNLLPENGEWTEPEALDIAVMAITERFGVAADALEGYTVNPFFTASSGIPQPRWQFGFDAPDGTDYSYTVVLAASGVILSCERFMPKPPEAADAYYNQLVDANGAFFTWPIAEKAAFADRLPELFTQQQIQESQLGSELQAILSTGFCLPPPDAIPFADALALAKTAVDTMYRPASNWADGIKVYSSFYKTKSGTSVWRVIFWEGADEAYASGIVELDALTGDILTVKKNGNTADTFIPYVDRL